MTGLDLILAELRASAERMDARAAEYEAARQETRDTIAAGAEATDRAFAAAIAGARS